jgi:outer membrane protein assembly factor BamB
MTIKIIKTIMTIVVRCTLLRLHSVQNAILWVLCLTSASTLASALLSCSQQQVPLGFNLYGGASRANNYENVGNFSSSFTFQEKTRLSAEDKTTKLAGASSLTVPLSFYTAYIPTNDGYVARVTSKLVEWRTALDAKAVIVAGAVADKFDNFYGIASDGALYSIGTDGKRRWKQPVFTPALEMLFLDVLWVGESLIAGASSPEGGELVKVGVDGKILWRQVFTTSPVKTCAADEQENLYVALSHGAFGASDTVLAIAPEGKRRWATGLEQTRLLRMPAVAGDMVYVTGVRQLGAGATSERVATLIALNRANGKQMWETTLFVPAQGIAANGEMVVIAGAKAGVAEPYSAVQAFSLQGKELWRKGFAMNIITPPMISKESIAFLGQNGEAVGIYYMKRDGTFSSVFSISDMPPMFLQPSVDYECNMVFATTEDAGIVRVGKSPAQKILPY